MVHLLFGKLAHGIFQIKKKKVDICDSLSHVYRGRERFLKNNFLYLYLAVLNLCCCVGFSLVSAHGLQ